MTNGEGSSAYRKLSVSERKRLFLDVLTAPKFADPSGWGACFHAWIEEQAAEGLCLGEIAGRIDLPTPAGPGNLDAWHLLDGHVVWMIEQTHARVVRIEVIA